MSAFQRWLLVTILATFVLVVIGGTVRATGSGLGCPDWPTCHGQIIPPAERHTLIEFSHRTAAFVVGLLFLGVTWFAFRTERRNKVVFWLAFTAGVLLAVQIVLGGITVKRELPPEIVALHLATAMAFMGVLIATAAISLMQARGVAPLAGALDSSFARLAILTAAATFVTLVLGSYISGTDAALACDGWPLCNGEIAPSAGGSAVGLHLLHRLLAGLLGVLLLGTIYMAFEEGRGARVVITALLAGAIYITQALIGAANIWTTLADGVVVLHLSLAALLWCMMVALSAIALYAPGRLQEAAVQGDASRKVSEWAR